MTIEQLKDLVNFLETTAPGKIDVYAQKALGHYSAELVIKKLDENEQFDCMIITLPLEGEEK